MEFLEDETRRPRFLFQSRASSTNTTSDTSSNPVTLIKTTNLTAFLCFVSSSLLLFSAFYFLSSFHFLNFLLVWISLSLLLGPFAPTSLTAGDIRVGHGDLLDDEPEDDPDSTGSEQLEEEQKRPRRSRRSDLAPPPPPAMVRVSTDVKEEEEKRNKKNGRGEEVKVVEETEWNEADIEMLKKHMAKHPVGTPRRWEAIAEAFDGRHGVDSVIRTAKSLSERRPGTGDSFAQFLRQRKPVDRRVEEVIGCEISGAIGADNRGDIPKGGGDIGNLTWTSGEDIALLNALKSFPKDTAMRWEKIEAAVPGKTKASCMKRVAELKRDFRSSKASDA